MKVFKLTFLLILFSQISFGQKTNYIQEDEFLFEQGLLLQQMANYNLKLEQTINSKDETTEVIDYAQFVKDIILINALTYYQVLIDSFPESELLYRALNNKGFIELSLDETEKATITFKQIIESKANDLEKGGIGSGIMAEPYANYKNRAARTLAEIYIKKNDYKEAIKYLDLTQKYRYVHFCGNEYAANNIYMDEQYAKCYLGLNDTDKALKLLLPNLFNDDLASNTSILNLTIETLLKKYSKNELNTIYENAFKTHKTEIVKHKNTAPYTKYYITFIDTDLEIKSYLLNSSQEDQIQEEITSHFKKTQFYWLLNKK